MDRISGKVGQTNLGLLNMFTDEVELNNGNSIIKNNFNAVRINHDFAKSVSIGLINQME